MLRERRRDPEEGARPRKSRLNDLWLEVYGPDVAVVEAMSARLKAWLLDQGLSYSGPACSRKRRWFSLRDYADRYNSAEERREECVVHRFGVMSISVSQVDELQQFHSPNGARMMVKTRPPWLPVQPVVTAGHSNWRDD